MGTELGDRHRDCHPRRTPPPTPPLKERGVDTTPFIPASASMSHRGNNVFPSRLNFHKLRRMSSSPALEKPERRSPWRRRLQRWGWRVDFYPRLEIGFALLALVLGIASYWLLQGQHMPSEGVSPSLVTGLLVANLVPLMALVVLIARRLAILLTNRREGRAGARMHIRLVGLFSTIAAVPTLLVVVFAMLLFQFGVQFWFSDSARGVLENADRVSQAYLEENKQRIVGDIGPMAGDISTYARAVGLLSPAFREGVENQVLVRGLTEASVFTPHEGDYLTFVNVGMTGRPLKQRVLSFDLDRARHGETVVIASAPDRVEAITRLDPIFDRYIYVSRKLDPQVLANAARTQSALSDYKQLIQRSRALQWRFFAMLVIVSLFILAAAIWLALWLANRLVAPIGRLARAAERVGQGDMSARVSVRDSPDELGTLARAFNRMTQQIEGQRNALVTANAQLDSRRQFTEAVLAGVSAGVVSVDRDHAIRLANRSAGELLEGRLSGSGGKLTDAVPELADLLDQARAAGHSSGQVEIARGAETQTLAVRAVAEADGYVVTFDDISRQLADQRRAAWADVARRIAHEIKNPLTPIQLSAERLQRKYGSQITSDPETFASLTSTIVRQVGDLRRMVDEFSSFARMPKPLFKAEPVLDIVRQAMLLQEVTYPAIDFTLDAPEDIPPLVCDRRQLAQAMTNLLKNAAESVAARQARDGTDGGAIGIAVTVEPGRLTIAVADNGLGLPSELRDRITEPYVTTRAKGTGLGLAIVKKIVEDHAGTLDISDAAGGGAVARVCFDLAALGALAEAADLAEDETPPARQAMGQN